MQTVESKIFEAVDNGNPIIIAVGKTTIFKKLCNHSSKNTNICPLLAPTEMKPEFSRLVKNVKEELAYRFNNSDVWTVSEWKSWWLCNIMGNSDDRETIEHFLTIRNIKSITIIDGLDEIFTNLENDENQRKCLEALLQDVPMTLEALPEQVFGLVVFVDSKLVSQTITQNEGQFLHKWSCYRQSVIIQ